MVGTGVATSPPLAVWLRVVKRSLTLFLLGLFLNDGYYLEDWRIPGVLQYFGISYLVTSFTVLAAMPLTKVSTEV